MLLIHAIPYRTIGRNCGSALRLGHPEGLPDESSYLRVSLVPLELYGIVGWFRRLLRIPDSPGGPQAAA
jgi:hypothetical protein